MKQALDLILGQTSALDSLSDQSRSLLKRALHPIVLRKNDTLFCSYAEVDGCYLIESGALKVSMLDHVGAEIWLAIVGAGDWVGELGLIDRNPRSATVTSMTESRLWRLSTRDFDALREADFEFYHCMVRLVCGRLRATNQQISDQRLGVQARLAQSMLKLAKAFGDTLSGGMIVIRYKIDQSNLAEISGASREQVNRQFRAWKDAGLCEIVNGFYCLKKIQKWESLGGRLPPTNTG